MMVLSVVPGTPPKPAVLEEASVAKRAVPTEESTPKSESAAETPDPSKAEVAPEVHATTPEEAPETQATDAEAAEGSDGSDVIPVPEIAASRGKDPLGARIQTLNPDLAAVLGVPGGKGVLLLDVESGGLAEKVGLKSGDVITRVGKYKVTSSEDVLRLLELGPSASSIRAYREGTERVAKFKLVAAVAPKSEEPAAEAPQAEAPAAIAPQSTEADAAAPAVKAPEADAAPVPQAETTQPATPQVLPLERALQDLQKELQLLKEEVRRIRAELDQLKST
jgi:pyruvate/2-oxoglutarate dehydrogenase complex dihydrolipoamide acyltransferase (E2) component